MKVGRNSSNCQLVCSILLVVLIHGCSAAEFKPEYNTQEREALTKFRELVNEVLNRENMKTDEFLIRWIKDAEFNLEKASKKLRKSIEWKAANKIDQLELKDLNSTYPAYIAGYDRTGTPSKKKEILVSAIRSQSPDEFNLVVTVYRIDFGSWDLRRAALAGKRVALNRHMNALMEQGVKHSDELRKQGQNVTQWILVVNFIGFSLREHMCLSCLPFYTDFIIDYEGIYPGTIKHIVGINAPQIFYRVLDLARPLMSPTTRNGVVVVFGVDKAEWQNWFLSVANPERLITRFGGTQDRF